MRPTEDNGMRRVCGPPGTQPYLWPRPLAMRRLRELGGADYAPPVVAAPQHGNWHAPRLETEQRRLAPRPPREARSVYPDGGRVPSRRCALDQALGEAGVEPARDDNKVERKPRGIAIAAEQPLRCDRAVR